MSVSLSFDHSGDAGQLANAAGWSALYTWLHGVPLERCAKTEHLASYGFTDEPAQVAKEVDGMLKADNPPPGVKSVLEGLQRMLKARDPADRQLIVSSGVED